MDLPSAIVDPDRVRKILQIATELETSASQWIRMDERGGFEKVVRSYLLDPKLAERAKALNLSGDDLDRQIAIQINLLGVQAMLNQHEKRDKTRTA